MPKMKGVMKPYSRLLSDSTGYSETVKAPVSSRAFRVNRYMSGPIKSHLATGHWGSRRRLFEGEKRQPGHWIFALIDDVRGCYIVLMETVKGPRVIPHVAGLNLEVWCGWSVG